MLYLIGSLKEIIYETKSIYTDRWELCGYPDNWTALHSVLCCCIQMYLLFPPSFHVAGNGFSSRKPFWLKASSQVQERICSVRWAFAIHQLYPARLPFHFVLLLLSSCQMNPGFQSHVCLARALCISFGQVSYLKMVPVLSLLFLSLLCPNAAGKTAQSKCRLEHHYPEGYYKDGDLIIGALLSQYLTWDVAESFNTQPPLAYSLAP